MCKSHTHTHTTTHMWCARCEPRVCVWRLIKRLFRFIHSFVSPPLDNKTKTKAIQNDIRIYWILFLVVSWTAERLLQRSELRCITHTQTNTCMYVSLYIYISIFVYPYRQARVSIVLHPHTHTHTYTRNYHKWQPSKLVAVQRPRRSPLPIFKTPFASNCSFTVKKMPTNIYIYIQKKEKPIINITLHSDVDTHTHTHRHHDKWMNEYIYE